MSHQTRLLTSLTVQGPPNMLWRKTIEEQAILAEWKMSACPIDERYLFLICFPMNILVWNCQGATSRSFCRTLKNLIFMYKSSILCLLEPKVLGFQIDKICSEVGFDERLRVKKTFGYSGGTWVFWNEVTSIKVLQTHPQFILLSIAELNSQNWFLSLVYGSLDLRLRREMFSNLSPEVLNIKGPWLLHRRLQFYY